MKLIKNNFTALDCEIKVEMVMRSNFKGVLHHRKKKNYIIVKKNKSVNERKVFVSILNNKQDCCV